MAKLKVNLDGELPEEFKGFFSSDDSGGYELDLDKLVSPERLSDFRNENIRARQKGEKLESSLSEAMEEIKGLKAQLDDGNKKSSSKDRETNDLLARIENLEKANKEKDSALEKERDRANRQRIKLDLSKALAEAGAKDKAIADAVEIASAGWAVEGETLKLYKNDEIVFSKHEAGEPISPAEFVADFLRERPYYLAETQGDGVDRGTSFKMVNGRMTIDPNDSLAMGRVSEEVEKGKLTWEQVDLTPS